VVGSSARAGATRVGRDVAAIVLDIVTMLPGSPASMPTTPCDFCHPSPVFAGRQERARRLLLPLQFLAPAFEVVAESALRHALQSCYLVPRDSEEARERDPLSKPNPLA
jgi:hypothetical protein